MDPRVDQLITEALTLAMREEKNGVEMYDYAIAELQNDRQHILASYAFAKSDATTRRDTQMTYSYACTKLVNLREAYITDEFEYMMERAPLKQGDRRDGVV